jgi:hypothetical protein
MNRFHQLAQRFWGFLRAYPPLLALALLIPVLSIVAVADLCSDLSILRRGVVHAGVAAYLLSIVGFVALGRRNQPWPAWTQIGVAAALGIAVALSAQLYATHYRTQSYTIVCTPPPADPRDASEQRLLCESKGASIVSQSDAKDAEAKGPLDGINALAAVLAVALAVLTLVAQKSASEARGEAEKAQEMVVGGWGIKMSGIWTRLALESQRLRESGKERIKWYEAYETLDPDLANLHRKWSGLHGATSSFLVDLVHAVDGGESDQLVQECARIAFMANDLDTSHRNQSDAPAHDLLRDQTRRFVAPLRRLLSQGIELGDVDSGQMNPEHQRELRAAMRALDVSLRVLT